MVRRITRRPRAESPAQGVAYATLLAGRPYVRSWATSSVGRSRIVRFISLQQIHTEALHAGRRIERRITELICDPDLHPQRMSVVTAAGRTEFRFARRRCTVRFPDGSSALVPARDVDIVLPANDPALYAMLVRALHAQGRMPFRGRAFSAGSLVTLEYEILRAKRGWRTTLGESLHLDHDGFLTRLKADHARIERLWARGPRWRIAAPLAVRKASPRVPRGLQSVDVRTSLRGSVLWGRLTSPRVGATLGCVLIIGGSGVHDRFGRAGRIDLGYFDLATGLAARGFACLQYDKPGAGRTRFTARANAPRFSGELALARAWARAAQRRFGLGKPLFLLGHSQGGQIALALAASGTPAAAICVAATAARPMDVILRDQVLAQAKDLGLDRRVTSRQVAMLRRYFDWIRRSRPASRPPRRFAALAHLAQWYRELGETSPERTTPAIRSPLLIVQGGADIQVRVRDSVILESLARRSGATVVARLIFPHLDHLLKRSRGEGNIARYADQRRRVDASVIQSIAKWFAAIATGSTLLEEEQHADDHRRRKRDERPILPEWDARKRRR